MEQNTNSSPVPTSKVYSIKAIVIGTLIGGLFAAAYMLSANFRALEQPKRAAAPWIYAILLFIALIVTAFIPAMNKIPDLAYTVAVAVLVTLYVDTQQAKLIRQHLGQGGATHSTGRVAAIAAIGLILIVSIALLAFALSDMYVRGPHPY